MTLTLDTFMDYQIAAAKTSKFAGEDNMHTMRRAVAALGLVDEALEVAEVLADAYRRSIQGDFGMFFLDGNLLAKELGDVWWYVAELHTAHCDMCLHESVPELLFSSGFDPVVAHLVEDGSVRAQAELALYSTKALEAACKAVGEMVKKHLGHDHPVCIEDLGEALQKVVIELLRLAQVWELDTGRILTENIAKLRKRYGEKFSAEKSIHRAPGDV